MGCCAAKAVDVDLVEQPTDKSAVLAAGKYWGMSCRRGDPR
jgi:hypothetical protein